VACEVFLARLKLVQGDPAGAAALLTRASQSASQHTFVYLMPEGVAAQVATLLQQGNLAPAAELANTHQLLMSQARVHLAQGNPSIALETLDALRQQAETKGWADERLKVMVIQAIAHHAKGEKDEAVQLLGDALAIAEPGGFIRLFVDEGPPMAQLMAEAANHPKIRGIAPDYLGKLRSVLEAEEQKGKAKSSLSVAQPLIEPLSERELEVLRLIAQGLSNRDI